MSAFKKLSLTTLRRAALSAIVLLTLDNTIAAEPVRINNGTAHGYLFEFAGNCYLATPRHAVKLGGRVAISTSEPVLNGGGFANLPFWEGMDLAVVVVSRGIRERCRGRGGELLSGRFDPVADQRGEMVLIRSSGQILRRPMRVTRTDYLTFEAELLDVADPDADDVFQGMSGTFFFVNGKPVGMALKKPEGEDPPPNTLTYMRIEEIAMNLGRWLGNQSTVFAPKPERTPDPSGDSLPLILIDAQTPAVDTDSFPENILSDAGAYVFKPNGTVSVILQLDSDRALPMKQVLMQSVPAEGQTAPQGIRIEVDSSQGDRPRWRSFWGGQMRRDGVLDTGQRSATFARRIRVTVTSAWGSGPVRIDRLEVR